VLSSSATNGNSDEINTRITRQQLRMCDRVGEHLMQNIFLLRLSFERLSFPLMLRGLVAALLAAIGIANATLIFLNESTSLGEQILNTSVFE
jgi:hypothetical protein